MRYHFPNVKATYIGKHNKFYHMNSPFHHIKPTCSDTCAYCLVVLLLHVLVDIDIDYNLRVCILTELDIFLFFSRTDTHM
jgi:hypothetical protein